MSSLSTIILCFCILMFSTSVTLGGRSLNSPHCTLKEHFHNVTLRKDGGYFWILNYGYNSTTQDRDVFESYTGPGSSVVSVNNDFARMSLFPNVVPTNFFYASEISEFHSKLSLPGTHGRWYPENFGKDIIFTGTIRFSPNIQKDGKGNTVGSAGIWLYNLPYSYTLDEYVLPPQAFGIQWTSDKNSSPFPGFSAVVYDNDFFPYFLKTPKKLQTLNNWFTYKVVWSKAGSLDKFSFSINNENLGTYVSSTSFQPLGYEIWVDNQTIDDTGEIELAQAPSVQYLDIDKLVTSKIKSNDCPRVAP